jgi:Transcriptional regulators
MTSKTFLEFQNIFAEFLGNYRFIYRGSILDELECSELTFRQFVYLDSILKMDKPTYGDISRKLKISKPSVTAIVNKLISLGYLKRTQSSDDRRVFHISAGVQGSVMIDVEKNAMNEFARRMTSCLTEAELTSFTTFIAKVNACYMLERLP